MACKDIKVMVNIQSTIPTLLLYCEKDVRMDEALYIYLHFHILPSLSVFFLACHHHISFRIGTLVIKCLHFFCHFLYSCILFNSPLLYKYKP